METSAKPTLEQTMLDNEYAVFEYFKNHENPTISFLKSNLFLRNSIFDCANLMLKTVCENKNIYLFGGNEDEDHSDNMVNLFSWMLLDPNPGYYGILNLHEVSFTFELDCENNKFQSGDMIVFISTDKPSKSIIDLLSDLKKKGVRVVCLSNLKWREMGDSWDIIMYVPFSDIPTIQHTYILIYNIIAHLIEIGVPFVPMIKEKLKGK